MSTSYNCKTPQILPPHSLIRRIFLRRQLQTNSPSGVFTSIFSKKPCFLFLSLYHGSTTAAISRCAPEALGFLGLRNPPPVIVSSRLIGTLCFCVLDMCTEPKCSVDAGKRESGWGHLKRLRMRLGPMTKRRG